mmetsp:Transcript_84977/g.259488  ORF Transcript_84977/g.259488 Transcript_84977/m.259488 type:complete len:359 (+) Transcript_84977:618-1694(+)
MRQVPGDARVPRVLRLGAALHGLLVRLACGSAGREVPELRHADRHGHGVLLHDLVALGRHGRNQVVRVQGVHVLQEAQERHHEDPHFVDQALLGTQAEATLEVVHGVRVEQQRVQPGLDHLRVHGLRHSAVLHQRRDRVGNQHRLGLEGFLRDARRARIQHGRPDGQDDEDVLARLRKGGQVLPPEEEVYHDLLVQSEARLPSCPRGGVARQVHLLQVEAGGHRRGGRYGVDDQLPLTHRDPTDVVAVGGTQRVQRYGLLNLHRESHVPRFVNVLASVQAVERSGLVCEGFPHEEAVSLLDDGLVIVERLHLQRRTTNVMKAVHLAFGTRHIPDHAEPPHVVRRHRCAQIHDQAVSML